MRQIVPDQNLVFLSDDNSYTVSCIDLVNRKIAYVGEDNDGLWVEYTPFTGRVRVFDDSIINLLFFRARAQRDAVPGPATVEEARTRRSAEINGIRDTKIAEGLPYTFPARAGTIQLRNQADISNILGVAAVGMSLIVTGDSTTTVDFRDSEDTTHTLTGQQVLVMGLAVSQFIGSQYAASWAHKDALAGIFSVPDINAYDTNAGWPT
jgi:hypothetical protein